AAEEEVADGGLAAGEAGAEPGCAGQGKGDDEPVDRTEAGVGGGLGDDSVHRGRSECKKKNEKVKNSNKAGGRLRRAESADSGRRARAPRLRSSGATRTG